MAKKPITLKQFTINLLRRGTWRWSYRNRARQRNKLARNKYLCEECKGIFGNRDTKIDHVIPVVDPVIGFVDWNTYISRMYVEDDRAYALLCVTCHKQKTKQENEIRKEQRALKKGKV